MKVKIVLLGFSSKLKDKELEVDIEMNALVRDVINRLSHIVDPDEIMIICNNKQLYLDDVIPENCRSLEIYPLAHGG